MTFFRLLLCLGLLCICAKGNCDIYNQALINILSIQFQTFYTVENIRMTMMSVYDRKITTEKLVEWDYYLF